MRPHRNPNTLILCAVLAVLIAGTALSHFAHVAPPAGDFHGRLTHTGLYLSLIGILVLAVFAWFTQAETGRSERQLKAILDAGGGWEDGDLKKRIPVVSKDALGHLSEVFNGLTDQLEESRSALTLHDQYYRSLIENSPGIFIILGSTRSIQYTSPSYKRVLSYSRTDTLGKKLDTFVHPQDLDPFLNLIGTVLKDDSKKNVLGSFRLKHKDGGPWHEMEAVGRNLLNDPAVNGIILNCRNIRKQTRFEKALRKSEERLRFLTANLFSLQEQKAKRLSNELHDEVGQILTLVKLNTTRIKSGLRGDQSNLLDACNGTLDNVNSLIGNIRRICKDLAPSALEDLGLTSALHWMIENFVKHNPIRTQVAIDPIDRCFKQENQILIYRLIQEALTNIGKHASASAIEISVAKREDVIHFKIEDNGIGFDVDHALLKEFKDRGMGLSAMVERARILGTQLDFDTGMDCGTKIEFSLKREE